MLAAIGKEVLYVAHGTAGSRSASGSRYAWPRIPLSGYVMAVMLTPPYEALVRWTDAEATFEALDDLVDVAS